MGNGLAFSVILLGGKHKVTGVDSGQEFQEGDDGSIEGAIQACK